MGCVCRVCVLVGYSCVEGNKIIIKEYLRKLLIDIFLTDTILVRVVWYPHLLKTSLTSVGVPQLLRVRAWPLL